jgi:MptA/FolE2 family GTP cyclohydrolase
LLVRLEAQAGRVDIAFPWFMRKAAPVTGAQSMMDYEVRLVADAAPGKHSVEATIVVPVMSLCPSSKAIADYGAHNQRSHLTLTVRPTPGAAITLAELIFMAEAEASCELYGLLKRADEKFVTERAYDRPRFVEDLVRGIAARLIDDARLLGFSIAAENFESIHNHSAYAEIVRG